MATKVEFTRVENEAEINNTNIKDGQLLYTRDGKLYMDYGTARIKLTSTIELLTVDSTAPSECSIGDMYYNTTTNLIYTATGTDTWSSTGVTPSTKYLYVDLTNAKLYYYDGATFTSYGGGSSNDVVISPDQPTGNDWKIWIDSDEVGSQASEITNSYSTSTGLGYSANYSNEAYGGEVAWENEDITQSFGEQNITLPKIYKKIEIIYARSTSSINNIIITVYNNYNESPANITEGIGMVDNKIIFRQCCLNNTTLTFYASVIYNTYGTSTINDNYMIPKKIIGYK